MKLTMRMQISIISVFIAILTILSPACGIGILFGSMVTLYLKPVFEKWIIQRKKKQLETMLKKIERLKKEIS